MYFKIHLFGLVIIWFSFTTHIFKVIRRRTGKLANLGRYSKEIFFTYHLHLILVRAFSANNNYYMRRNEYLFSTDQSFYDLKLMHLSDFHIWFSSTLLEKVTEVIWDRKPDLLILTGDYYDFPTGAKLFSKFLKNIHY